MPPATPGYSITIKPASRHQFRFPEGPVWSSDSH